MEIVEPVFISIISYSLLISKLLLLLQFAVIPAYCRRSPVTVGTEAMTEVLLIRYSLPYGSVSLFLVALTPE